MRKTAALCAQAQVGPWPKTGSQAEPASPSSFPFLRGKPYGLGYTPAAIPPASARCRSRSTCRRFRAPGRQPFRLLAQRVADTHAQAISLLTRTNRLWPTHSPPHTAPVHPLQYRDRLPLFSGSVPRCGLPPYSAPTTLPVPPEKCAVPAQVPEAVCPPHGDGFFRCSREPSVSLPRRSRIRPRPTLPDRLRNHTPLRSVSFVAGRLTRGCPHQDRCERQRNLPLDRTPCKTLGNKG